MRKWRAEGNILYTNDSNQHCVSSKHQAQCLADTHNATLKDDNGGDPGTLYLSWPNFTGINRIVDDSGNEWRRTGDTEAGGQEPSMLDEEWEATKLRGCTYFIIDKASRRDVAYVIDKRDADAIAALPDVLRALVMVANCPQPPVPPGGNQGDYGLTDIEPAQRSQIAATLAKARIE